jgi:quercetin dioxygenase-like cupin family protein
MQNAKFTVVPASPDDFAAIPGRLGGGYRDLKMSDATEGHLNAIVARAKQGEEVPTSWHYHVCDLHISYVLNGWQEIEIADEGLVRIEAGSVFNLFAGTVHRGVRTSPDWEALTITIPAKIETVKVEAPGAVG